MADGDARFADTKWLCVLKIRDGDGTVRFPNITIEASDAFDACDQALAGQNLDIVEGLEVERA